MIRVSILASVLLVLTPVAAYAAAVCTVGASGVDFGVFSGSQLTTVGSIGIACTGSGQVNNATLSLSTGSSGTYAARLMRNGPSSLIYNLYSDPAFTQVWGDGDRLLAEITTTHVPT